MLKVIAFFTNSFYGNLCIKLTHSLNKFGVTYETRFIKAETWSEAVMRKPEFILESLRDSACKTVVYTDADSELLRPIPEADLSDCDLGYVEWRRSPHHEPECLTGTMAFKNTKPVQDFVEEWAHETPKYRHTFTPEQMSLKELLAKPHALKVKKLPVEFCYIADDMRETNPDAQAIFAHYQASRQYKEIEKKASQEAGKLSDGMVED